MAKKSRVSITQNDRKDFYSWEVFVDGYPKWTRLSKAKAFLLRDEERRKLGETK